MKNVKESIDFFFLYDNLQWMGTGVVKIQKGCKHIIKVVHTSEAAW